MQIVVLGMHRAGTSCLTRLINLMGAYVGEDDELMRAKPDNVKGFWERRDVEAINDEILRRRGGAWFGLPHVEEDSFPDPALDDLVEEAVAIVADLDAHGSWVVKDPRMCLTFPFWRPLLNRPVCLFSSRHPLQVAQSLRQRNKIPLTVGVAIWEKHVLAALRASQNLPRFVARYEQAIADPVSATRAIHEQLATLDAEALRLPSEQEILNFVDPKLNHGESPDKASRQVLNQAQADLHRAIETGDALTLDSVPEPSLGGLEAHESFMVGMYRERMTAATLAHAHQSLCLPGSAPNFNPPTNVVREMPLSAYRATLDAFEKAVTQAMEDRKRRLLAELARLCDQLANDPELAVTLAPAAPPEIETSVVPEAEPSATTEPPAQMGPEQTQEA